MNAPATPRTHASTPGPDARPSPSAPGAVAPLPATISAPVPEARPRAGAPHRDRQAGRALTAATFDDVFATLTGAARR